MTTDLPNAQRSYLVFIFLQAAKHKQRTQAEIFPRGTPYDYAHPKVACLNSLLVDSVCKKGVSFRLVDSE